MEGRDLVARGHPRATTGRTRSFARDGRDARAVLAVEGARVQDEARSGGWSIDLNRCTGCNACAVACQSENNVPVVGKEQVRRGREMAWIRIDRYFTGEPDEAGAVFQPVPCMQCENAPCEQVCPVAATVHDDDGLNAMVYNRCIGTRYCSNNCPYKVRRFNFFNYTKDTPELAEDGHEPGRDRARPRRDGEVHLLRAAARARRRSTPRLAGRELRDGDAKTACQQACPAEAIRFGDLLDAREPGRAGAGRGPHLRSARGAQLASRAPRTRRGSATRTRTSSVRRTRRARRAMRSRRLLARDSASWPWPVAAGWTSSQPPIHVNPSMDQQPKYRPQAESAFFYDGATMRPPVARHGRARRAARGPGLLRGQGRGGQATSPAPRSRRRRTVLARGAERYRDLLRCPATTRAATARASWPARQGLPTTSLHTRQAARGGRTAISSR